MMFDLIKTIFVSSVISVAVVGFVLLVLKTSIRQWITGAIEHIYAARLETLKADLAKRNAEALALFRDQLQSERAVNVAATSSFLAARAAAHDRTLEAVRELWLAFLGLRKAEAPILGVTGYLTPDEIRNLPRHPKYKDQFVRVADLYRNPAFSSTDIEAVRPFVGEVLWSLYFGQRALLGRMNLLFAVDGPSIREGRLMYYMDDRGIQQILASLLSPEEFATVRSQVVGAYWHARSLVEQKAILDARKVIEGEASADAALAQAKRIMSASTEALEAATGRTGTIRE